MPKLVVPLSFRVGQNPYYPDWMDVADPGVSASGRFNAPPDLTEANIDGIVLAVGASRGSPNSPCPDTSYTSLRKLEFVRASGNTMSVPVANRIDLITAATTIRNILDNAGTGGNKVVCIRLIGEEWANLNDELNLSYQAGTYAKTHRAPASAPKQYYYAGTVEYEADSTNPIDGSVFQPVKAISDIENAPATQLATTWAGCVGSFQTVIPCPRGRSRGNPLKHRRYVVTFLTKSQQVDDPNSPPTGIEADFASEQIEVPVTDGSEIDTCGVALAGLIGAYCIGYKGESYTRFHKLLN